MLIIRSTSRVRCSVDSFQKWAIEDRPEAVVEVFDAQVMSGPASYGHPRRPAVVRVEDTKQARDSDDGVIHEKK